MKDLDWSDPNGERHALFRLKPAQGEILRMGFGPTRSGIRPRGGLLGLSYGAVQSAGASRPAASEARSARVELVFERDSGGGAGSDVANASSGAASRPASADAGPSDGSGDSVIRQVLPLSSRPVDFFVPLPSGMTLSELRILEGGERVLPLSAITWRAETAAFVRLVPGRLSITAGAQLASDGSGRVSCRLPYALAGKGPFLARLRSPGAPESARRLVDGKDSPGVGIVLDLPRYRSALEMDIVSGRPAEACFRLEYAARPEIAFSFPSSVESVELEVSVAPPGILPGDPGALLLENRPARRDSLPALRRWDSLPDVLIAEYDTYADQDLMLKRLAFFAEKAGFRGRLARDEEIAGLHGWNAHDYRPETLAAFFNLAADESFPLNDQELALRDLCVETGLLLTIGDGRLKPGRGAFMSVSRESGPELERKLLAHEAIHAIYFTDAGYRELCAGLWDSSGEASRSFLEAYFAWMKYDVTDRDLVVNEFSSYLLQQSVKALPSYAQDVLALHAGPGGLSRAREALPGLVESAVKLEAWLARYGVTAGRVWKLSPHSP